MHGIYLRQMRASSKAYTKYAKREIINDCSNNARVSCARRAASCDVEYLPCPTITCHFTSVRLFVNGICMV